MGGVRSAHNLSRIKCENLMNKNQCIQVSLCKQDNQTRKEYRTRLTASVDVLRFLIRQGLPSRGHDESEGSSNRGNVLELLAWYAARMEDIGSVVLKNATGNNQLISSSIQKDIINACAKETTIAILEDLGETFFSILADESSDVSQKEQLSVCLRYVDRHDIEMPDMDDFYTPWGRSKRTKTKVSNKHHFRVEVFLKVLDQQLMELNRFDEVNTKLLVCMASLSPKNSFASFEKDKVLRLAEFYPLEFSQLDLISLDFQLDMFICDIRTDKRFCHLTELDELSIKLVETGKNLVWTYVYLLLKLVLTLLMATTSVERSFSAMKHVKSSVRNSMGDELLNDSLVVFIEREIASNVSNDTIIHRFQNMKTRREKL